MNLSGQIRNGARIVPLNSPSSCSVQWPGRGAKYAVSGSICFFSCDLIRACPCARKQSGRGRQLNERSDDEVIGASSRQRIAAPSDVQLSVERHTQIDRQRHMHRTSCCCCCCCCWRGGVMLRRRTARQSSRCERPAGPPCLAQPSTPVRPAGFYESATRDVPCSAQIRRPSSVPSGRASRTVAHRIASDHLPVQSQPAVGSNYCLVRDMRPPTTWSIRKQLQIRNLAPDFTHRRLLYQWTGTVVRAIRVGLYVFQSGTIYFKRQEVQIWHAKFQGTV